MGRRITQIHKIEIEPPVYYAGNVFDRAYEIIEFANALGISGKKIIEMNWYEDLMTRNMVYKFRTIRAMARRE